MATANRKLTADGKSLGDVWKQGKVWMVQGARARMSFRAKKTATTFAESLSSDDRKTIEERLAHKFDRR